MCPNILGLTLQFELLLNNDRNEKKPVVFHDQSNESNNMHCLIENVSFY